MIKDKGMFTRILIWILIGLSLIWFTISFFAYIMPKTKVELPLYFNYSPANLEYLDRFDSKDEITLKDIQAWDDIVFDLVRKNNLSDKDAARVYAYFYTAQRDAAFIAFNLKQRFAGSINSVSTQTLCLLFPHECTNLTSMKEEDTFSRQVGTLVSFKVAERMKKEQSYLSPSPISKGQQFWQGKIPYLGLDAGSMQTWLIRSAHEFRVKPPLLGKKEITRQLQMVEDARANATDEQKKAAVKWAGTLGTITLPGEWLKLANDYFIDNNLSLSKLFLYRSIIAAAITDAIIVAYDSKYTYWVKRPFMLNQKLTTIIPAPNSPSYPSSRAAVTCVASSLLSKYAPYKKDEWSNLAKQASNSGTWSGIEFPMDNSAGCELGNNIARSILKPGT